MTASEGLCAGALALAALAFSSRAALAAEPGALATYDQSPLALVHGLPEAGAVSLDEGVGVELIGDITNTLNEQRHGGETLLVDAELYRLAVRAAYRLDQRWRLQATLPLIAIAGGRLDAFIDDFHTLFGFPDGGRERAPRNQLRVRYERDGETLLDLNRAHAGPGDLRLALGREFDARAGRVLAWAQLKLPSGDPERLTGSGAADAALWLSAHARPASRWAVSAAAGVLLLGDGDVLAPVQRSETWFASAGGEFLWSERFALQLELAAHGALYDSRLRMLGEALQIASGGWVRFSGSSVLQIAVIEDIYVGSAPDVTFHLAWRNRY